MLYLLSIAVKDYEVSRLLAERNLANTQRPLLREMLPLGPLPWETIRRDRISCAIALAIQLKPIFFSLPLIGEDRTRELSKAPDEFLKWAFDASRMLGRDTVANVRSIARSFHEFLVGFTR